MKYFVQVGDREHEVEVRRAGEQLQLSLGGTEERIDLAAVEPGENYSLLLGRRSFAVSVDGDGRSIDLIVNGRSYQVIVENERERAVREISAGTAAAGGVVESVMPGIVRRIEVAPGDTVQSGDRLLILEAMKMENEIRAEADGLVEEIHVADGQAVDGGVPLITLRPKLA